MASVLPLIHLAFALFVSALYICSDCTPICAAVCFCLRGIFLDGVHADVTGNAV